MLSKLGRQLLNSTKLKLRDTGIIYPREREPVDLSFTDHKITFQSKYTSELIRAQIVYTLCLSKYLVNNNMVLMNKTKRILGENLFEKLMRSTVYGQFVAGEDHKEMGPVLDRLRSFGVMSILDYSVEDDLDSKEAEKLEIAAETSDSSETSISLEKIEIGGVMPQFKPNLKLADRRRHLKSARTYFYINEPSSERNFEIFLDSLKVSAEYSSPGQGMVAIKLTGLGKPQLLLQLSEAIVRARIFIKQIMGFKEGNENVIIHHQPREVLARKIKEAGVEDVDKFLESVETDSDGIIHLFPWSGIVDDNFELNETFRLPSLSQKKMVPLIERLSLKDEASFKSMVRRLRVLAQTAKKLNATIMVDAEQSYFQPAISRITMEMMHRFNTERPVVYNTYQMYLKKTHSELSSDLDQARRQNFCWGAKLVRGAYMVQERERAVEMGYEDPVFESNESTSESYHAAMTEVFWRIKEQMKNGGGKIKVMIASHNEDTVRLAVQQMRHLGIAPESGVVQFGQLLGMSDHITFPLGYSGYSVYKYVPYGPVSKVLPYLSRRAQENKAVLTKIKKEQKMLFKEILRRIFTAQIFHDPQLKPSKPLQDPTKLL